MTVEGTILPDAPEDELVRYAEGSADWDWLVDRIEELKEENPDPDAVDYRIEVYDAEKAGREGDQL